MSCVFVSSGIDWAHSIYVNNTMAELQTEANQEVAKDTLVENADGTQAEPPKESEEPEPTHVPTYNNPEMVSQTNARAWQGMTRHAMVSQKQE